MESDVWWDLWAGNKITGLSYFYPDLSCCNIRRVPSPCCYQRPHLGVSGSGRQP